MSPVASPARQPDTNLFRQWEAAGTSHFDHYGLLIGPSDTGDGQGAVANLAAMQHPTNVPGPRRPVHPADQHRWRALVAQRGDLLAEPVGHERHAAPEGSPCRSTVIHVPVRSTRRTPTATPSVACAHRRSTRRSRRSRGSATRRHQDGRSHLAVLPALRLDGAVHASADLAALYKNHGQFVSAWSNDIQQAREGRVPAPA